MDTLLSGNFDATRDGVLKGIEYGLIKMEEEDPILRNALMAYTLSRLTAEQYRDFYGRLKTLVDELNDIDNDKSNASAEVTTYGFTIILYPVREAHIKEEDDPHIRRW